MAVHAALEHLREKELVLVVARRVTALLGSWLVSWQVEGVGALGIGHAQ